MATEVAAPPLTQLSPGEPAPPSRRGQTATRIVLGALVAAGMLAGVFLRLWALGRQPVSSDVAVVGLMAHEILRGHFSAFYWGQHYGGGEPYVVALLFAIFGQSSFTLDLTTVVLDAVATVLIWRIGRRLFTPGAGIAAALLFWVWPEVYIWQSTVEYGFRFLALVSGLACLLAALRLSAPPEVEPPAGALWWALLGLSVGVGWWCTPEILYYAVPALGLIGWRALHRRVGVHPRSVVIAVASAVLGALPWLWANLGDDFASLRGGHGASAAFGGHLRALGEYAAPMLFGLRLRASGSWFVMRGGASVDDLGLVLYALILVALLASIVMLVIRRRALVLVAFVACFPLLYAASPDSWYWRDGRYALYLAPVAALLLIAATDGVARRVLRQVPDRKEASASSRTAFPLVLVVAVGLALTLLATTQLAPYRPEVAAGRTGWFTWRANPDPVVARVAADLERRHVTDVYAGYWLAYILDFESGERVTASDPEFDRHLPYLAAIEGATHAGWVFENPAWRGQAALALGNTALDPGCAARGERCLLPSTFEAWLRHHAIGYRVTPLGDFLLIQPASRIDPRRVLAAAGID